MIRILPILQNSNVIEDFLKLWVSEKFLWKKLGKNLTDYTADFHFWQFFEKVVHKVCY